jgi:glycosyltransferase involved in cell wall biosynthesis
MKILVLLRKVDCNDGISSYCQTLASGLSNNDIDTHIISGPIYFDENSKARKIAIENSVMSWIVIRDLKHVPSITALIQISKFISEKEITLINVQGLGMLFWGKLLSLITRRPFVATYHRGAASGDLARVKSRSNKSFSLLQRAFILCFMPKKLIVMSEESKKILSNQIPLLNNRIVKIPGGIDTNHFRPPTLFEKERSKLKFNTKDTDLTCVLVGRYDWNKGHDLVIKAACKLSNYNLNYKIKCLFAGQGLKDEISRFSKLFKHHSCVFEFLDFVHDVRELLWASDIFVLPSRVEGFALVIAEAMAAGVVPIRTPSGGASDQIIENKTGFLTPFEDSDAIVAAMLKLLDSKVRAEMSACCARVAAEKFSSSAMIDNTISLYAETSRSYWRREPRRRGQARESA